MWRAAIAPAAMPEAARRDREPLDRPRRHHAAAGVQQQEVAFVAALLELARQPRHVLAHERREDGVRHRGREPLVLEDLGQDLARDRDVDAGELLAQDLRVPLLVGRVRDRS